MTDPTPKAVVVPQWAAELAHRVISAFAPDERMLLDALAAPQASLPPVGGVRETLTTGIWDWTRSNTLHLGDIDKCRALAAHLAALSPVPSGGGEPVPVTIFCPVCAVPHIDEGEWATTRHHKTHQCQSCGHEWRPFPFATVGVAAPVPAVEAGWDRAVNLDFQTDEPTLRDMVEHYYRSHSMPDPALWAAKYIRAHNTPSAPGEPLPDEGLRAALDQIANMCPATCETSLAHSMAEIARKALEGSR